ncbi:MAG: RloB family protein [Spirochaetes bacterium]|nr:RloB family protein [Spirochaetota bacterium]
MSLPRERSNQERDKTKGKRLTYERILIVCEGAKTEPNYFKEIRQLLRLPEVYIRVMNCPTGTTPLQIVTHLEKIFKDSNAYDRGYCVFDRDEHPEYQNAITKVGALDGKIRNDDGNRIALQAIYSNPCFELWVLSHFKERVTRHIERKEVLGLLKKCLPAYTKGSSDIFEQTKNALDGAYAHAELMRALCRDRETDNPQTLVDILVKKLLSQRKDL